MLSSQVRPQHFLFWAKPLPLTLAAIFALLMALALPTSIRAQPHSPFEPSSGKVAPNSSVTISSTIGWQATVLNVQQGTLFGIFYTSGTWTVDVNNWPYVGPNGYPKNIDKKIYQGCKYDSSFPYATLLGQIGNGPDFRVGIGRVFTSHASGIVSLRINDQDQCLGDNGGSVVLTINIRKIIASGNYAGYAATGANFDPIVYTDMTATWTVPAVTCSNGENSSSGTWDGLGDNVTDLEQTGTVVECNNGLAVPFAFWQVYQGGNTQGPQRIYSFLVYSGDQVKAEVKSFGFGEFSFDIWNLTLPQHWSMVVSGDNSSKATALGECIQEDPQGASLSHFSTVTITCTANGQPIGSAGDIIQRFQMTKPYTKAITGGLDKFGAGDTFYVSWVHAYKVGESPYLIA